MYIATTSKEIATTGDAT